MKKLNCLSNEKIYMVDVYLMNDNYDTMENCVCQGTLEEVKKYFLNRYSGLREKHGIAICDVVTDCKDTVWFKEGI